MTRLTGRGIAVLVAAVALFVAGQWLGYPVLLVLAAIGAGVEVASLIVGAHRPRATVSREVYPDRVARGGARAGSPSGAQSWHPLANRFHRRRLGRRAVPARGGTTAAPGRHR
ncbi:hypothetical protein [Fodinicola feengrottensis]|uniref:hypothetical protein n=1 Tax=Fodinicola feengrottensis TaxID=435914 RepID=UPI00244236F2|nr:hypothetical protein [Fodinicola feengrottensis]